MKKKLEIGDKIAVLDGKNNADRIITVTRVTKTLALCERKWKYETRFNREVPSDMYFCEKGATGWSKTYYRLATDADLLHVKKTRLCEKIKASDWAKIPLEKIEAIIKILQQ